MSKKIKPSFEKIDRNMWLRQKWCEDCSRHHKCSCNCQVCWRRCGR